MQKNKKIMLDKIVNADNAEAEIENILYSQELSGILHIKLNSGVNIECKNSEVIIYRDNDSRKTYSYTYLYKDIDNILKIIGGKK